MYVEFPQIMDQSQKANLRNWIEAQSMDHKYTYGWTEFICFNLNVHSEGMPTLQ